jgi:hypothetical protein
MPFNPMSLRQWALKQGISPDKAYRMYHAGTLQDRNGNPVHTERLADGVIHVYPNKPPDPLATVDVDALVAKLRRAGYVVLTEQQARDLGVNLG